MSLYVERDSFIHHQIDPISKLIYIVAAIAIPFIIPTIQAAFLCMVISISLLLSGKVFKKIFPLIGFSLILLVSIVIIQGLFYSDNQTPLLTIGTFTFYTEGLKYALILCLRVVNMLSAFGLLVLTTKPADLIETLVRKGLSPKIGYVLGSVLQIIPQMVSTTATIMDAQRSRGMETEGKLSVRIKAFIPLIGPVVMNSLVSTRERAMALEVRGFNASNEKTFLNETTQHSCNPFIQWGLVILVLFALLWRLFI